jgi:hypothetical protein
VVATAIGDEILLRGGGRVSGVIVERTKDAVVVETAPGRLTLSMKRVEKIVESRSALAEFQDRAAELAPGDAAGWAALARWAAERDLVTQSLEAWRRVLSTDPGHPEANAAFGRVELDGDWVSEDEAYRARGYVPYEGRWVTPAEHEALVRERVAEEEMALQMREADLRVREAEARAREAEARAREAEAGPEWTPDGGIPLWWGWGGGPPLYPTHPGPPHPGPFHPQPPRPPEGTPHPEPPPPEGPSTPPSSRPTTANGPTQQTGSPASKAPSPTVERPYGRPSETVATRPN